MLVDAKLWQKVELMTDLQKRILAGGILFLCLISLLWTDDDHKVIGLTELLALCGALVCTVLLWSSRLTVSLKAWLIELLQVLHALGILFGVVMMIFGLFAILYAVSHPLSQLTNDTGIAKAAAIGVLSSVLGFALFAACKSRDKKS